MAYSFYDDDEDELNRYLERFASGGRDDLAYDPGYGYRASDYGGGGGYGGGVSAPIPVREDKRSWMEKNGFPLLMAAGSVAAAFADKSGRRGQNVQHALGQIAGAQMRSEQADRDDLSRDFELDRRAWQQQQGLDMNRELAGQRMAGDDADRELRASDQALRGRQSDELHQRYMQSQDPNSPQNQADLRYRQALAAQAEANAARDPNALTPYQLAQLDAQAEQRRWVNEDRDAQRTQVGEHQKAMLQQQKDAAAARIQKQEVEDHERQLTQQPIPGTKITDPDVWARVASDPVTRRKIEEAVVSYSGTNTAFDNMERLRAQEGAMEFGQEPGQYEIQKRAALGGLSGLTALGTLQKSDVELLEPTIPGPGMHWSNAVPFVPDQRLEALRGARKGFRDLVDPRLAPYGITYDYDYKPGQKPPPAQSGGGDAPAAASSGGSVQMMNPATGDSGPVPPDMVQAAEAAGWRRL